MKEKFIYNKSFGVIVNIEQEQQIGHVFEQSKPDDMAGVVTLTFAEAVKMVKESGAELKPITNPMQKEINESEKVETLQAQVDSLTKLVQDLVKGNSPVQEAASEGGAPEGGDTSGGVGGDDAGGAKVTAEQVGKWTKKVCASYLKRNEKEVPEGDVAVLRNAVIATLETEEA